MTTAPTDQKAAPRSRNRKELGTHVARTVASLQVQVLRDPPRPEAVGALARLRRGVGRTPGFDYTLETYLAVPDRLLGYRPAADTEATDAEYATHDAITLYALHQQSRRKRMHVTGCGLGTAMSALVRVATGPDGVRRRFAALGTASSYAEGIHHLRGLITMLREHEIGLDYGLLADDLRTLRRPEYQASVQAIWGREYFRNRPEVTNEAATDEAATDEPEEHSA